MTPIIIANWKMNLTLEKAYEFCKQLSQNNLNNSLIMAASTPYLSYLSMNFSKLEFCAQDVSSYANDGAYTGEYSATMLKSCSINYCIIGHSERRTLYNENDQIIKQKASNILGAAITPIICIGESLELRQSNKYKDYLLSQLQNCIPSSTGNLIIAYEPIWAIGTNLVPTFEQLLEAFDIIDSYLTYSGVAKKVRLVYGGSVNQNNIEKILAIRNVSGALIGAASLNYESLIQIIDKVIK